MVLGKRRCHAGAVKLATLAVALVLAGCGNGSDSTSAAATERAAATTSPAPSDTSAAPTTSTAPSDTSAAPTTVTTAAVSATSTTTLETPTITQPDSTTTTASEASDQTRPLIEGLGPELSAQVWEAAEAAEEVRGLDFEELPAITVLSPEEFEERVRMEVESELEDVDVDEALFKLLGLLAPEDDLAALYGELYGESVAGFYSSEDRQLVIPASGEHFTAIETLTLVHELVHALTDQHFDFGPRMEDLVDRELFDPASGLVSLVEGDATLSEFAYVNNLDVSARNRLMAEFADFESPELDIPLFMEKALFFPYDRGFEYVANRWREGGWKAVNDLYLDPPASTEEIYEGAASDSTAPVRMERPAGELPKDMSRSMTTPGAFWTY